MVTRFQQTGFSLIELCITLGLATILIAVGVPSFQNLSNQNHAEAHMEEFNSALRLARHIAVEHGRKSEICPRDNSDASATATADCDMSGDWNNGWIIRLNGEPIMRNLHQADGASITVTGPVGDKVIRFGTTGTLDNAASATVTISFGSCNQITEINLAGHLDLSTTGC